MSTKKVLAASGLLAGGIWAMAAGGMDVYYDARHLSLIRQEREAVSVPATVLRADLQTVTTRMFRYEVAYRFRTPGGETVEGADVLPLRGKRFRYEPGRQIEISYRRGSPESNWIHEDGEWFDTIAAMIVSGLYLIVGLGVAIWSAFRLRSKKQNGASRGQPRVMR